MLKFSNNYYAEMLFKTISAILIPAEARGKNLHASLWPGGRKRAAGTPVIKNGSGMVLQSHKRVAVGWAPAIRWTRKFFTGYLNSFPARALTGHWFQDLKNKLKGIRGTGTLNDFGVSTLSGYVLLPKGTMPFRFYSIHEFKISLH